MQGASIALTCRDEAPSPRVADILKSLAPRLLSGALGLSLYMSGIQPPWGRRSGLLVLCPALDLELLNGERAEGCDEGRGKTGVRQEGDIEVDRCTT